MSTRSAIIQKTDDGFKGIYCHYDGYPDGVGKTLEAHYKDADKVARLIALGEISSLGAEVEPTGPHSFGNAQEGVTVAYHRDRGEDATEPYAGKTVDEVADQIGHNGYVYVFDGGWKCNGKTIAEVMQEEAA